MPSRDHAVVLGPACDRKAQTLTDLVQRQTPTPGHSHAPFAQEACSGEPQQPAHAGAGSVHVPAASTAASSGLAAGPLLVEPQAATRTPKTVIATPQRIPPA
ncbi:MAG TPA: hypothetical protein VK762_25455 [Polyangiaceae bacterium]|nr:hypothetical protein [Polyangiaceae bacterium]